MLEDKVQIAEKAEKGRNIFAFGISQRAINDITVSILSKNVYCFVVEIHVNIVSDWWGSVSLNGGLCMGNFVLRIMFWGFCFGDFVFFVCGSCEWVNYKALAVGL